MSPSRRLVLGVLLLGVAAALFLASSGQPPGLDTDKPTSEGSWVQPSSVSQATDTPLPRRLQALGTVPHGVTISMIPTPEPPVLRNRSLCPRRWMFVNTHTYGRHHNQLQEFMNLILWADALNRTVVLGWFRHNHKWVEVGEFYNMSRIAARYCVITAAEFRQQLLEVGYRKVTASCWGQGVDGTPLRRYGVRCSMVPAVPAYYSTRYALNITRGYWPRIQRDPAIMLVLSGQISFFLKAGIRRNAALYGLLLPAADIAAEVDAFTRRSLWDARASAPAQYFAIHLRQRERECLREIREMFDDSGSPPQPKSNDRVVLETMCAITVPHIQSLQRSLGFDPQGEKVEGVVFLASDHENMALEKQLVSSGAQLYGGGKFHTLELGGLKGLAVDFFLLTRGAYFTGNQLSSITQNVCFVRLGQGKSCHGFIIPWASPSTDPGSAYESL